MALDPEYVAARRVLMDALDALEGHRDNLVLVGAQAVYHHTGDAELNVPVMTTDADLAIDTAGLADAPGIGETLRAAGFTPGPNPGHWVALSAVAVDIMVATSPAGPDPRRVRHISYRTTSSPPASPTDWSPRSSTTSPSGSARSTRQTPAPSTCEWRAPQRF